MHITFWFSSRTEKFLRLPSANLHIFQSMLYSLLPPDLAATLHNTGFNSDGKTLKLFAMSWPASDSRPVFGNSAALFPLPVRLTVSTPNNTLILSLAACALGRDNIRIGINNVSCSRVQIERQTPDGSSIIIRTLSPITCYVSEQRNGKPYTHYFSPEEPEFQEGLRANIVRKFRALFHEREVPANFRITPLGQVRQRVSMYDRDSKFPIEGWWGRFRLEGDEELLQTALDCGLGAKNSGGWGCITKE